ncbi:hypothetical protein OIE73_05920 [Streptomyces hirsutus]|uniref:Integral membrane protein n=1 Tax=Streptomyces hirsutus TaxID=35620 RepID=A0ABZ1GGT2_9ACTN|nr:hypothetical protein [Streptomyces hirsutus]WSD05339.1 hypothetical protein OIE73_05920 [Streptomyces hirsutus]
MPWSEAALVIAVCWAVSGLGYGVLAALDEPQLSVAPLIGLGLAQWFFARHRCWRAAVAASLAGPVVLFGLVDVLRPDLGRYVADALATGAAATVALTVFALVGRAGGRHHDAAG